MTKRNKRNFYSNLSYRRALIASAPFLMAAAAAQDLSAVTYNATDLATLRTAIDSANAGSTDDIIEIASGTYTLTGAAAENANASGDLDITKATGNLIIRPATGASVIIDGGAIDRVFHINAGAGITVTIEDLTIRNGRATDNGSVATEARGGGILLQQGNLTLDGVTLTGNTAVGANGAAGASATTSGPGGTGGIGVDAAGGALYLAAGTVSITECTLGTAVSGNSAVGGNGGAGGNGSGSGGDGGNAGAGGQARGGGVFSNATSLTITDTTLENNDAVGGNGGLGGVAGIGFGSDGDCGSGGNGGAANGAGLHVAGGTVAISGSTISNGHADAGDGGNGPNNAGFTATFAGAGGDGGSGGTANGGGISIAAGTVSLVNSTVSGNLAAGGTAGSGGDGADAWSSGVSDGDGGNGGAGGNGFGGGIQAGGGTLSISNSTVANNTSSFSTGGTGGATGTSLGGAGATPGATGASGAAQGGGALNSGAAVTSNSSIFADNTAVLGVDFAGNVTAGASLFETAPSGTLTPGTGANITGSDPVLGPLQNNGGSTLTQAIDSASPARNVGSNPLALTEDQVGNMRDDGNGVDMGAVEFGSTPPVTGTTPPVVTTPAAGVTVNAANFNIIGTAPADSLVRIYSDLNNNGLVDGADAVVGQQQLTGGATAYNISVPLTQDLANDFTATADDAALAESSAVNVPTITEDSTAPTGLVVTDPASATNTTGATYNIQGTAEANALVQIYSDFNNNGLVDGADAVVASEQLTGGATAFNIATPITASTTNNFVATATDAAANEGTAVDVPTITETTPPAILPPVVTTPSAPVSVNLANFNIAGTAPANALVRIYSDANNDGFINGADAVVASQQLTGGATAFSVPTPLVQNTTNNFLATAFDGANESLPVDVPTITDTAGGGGSGGGGGGGDGGGGCAVQETSRWGWLAAPLIAAFALLRRRRSKA